MFFLYYLFFWNYDLPEKVFLPFSKIFYYQQYFLLTSLFFSKVAHAFLCLLYKFLSLKDLFSRNLFLSFDLIRIACWSSQFIKAIWFAHRNLRFSGAIEYKTVRHVSWNLFKLLSCLDIISWFIFVRSCSQKILLLQSLYLG